MDENTRLFLKDQLPFLHIKPDDSLRDIDAQVAEKIMGWVGIRQQPFQELGPKKFWIGYRSKKDQEEGNYEHIPSYSTDLNLAYEVVYVMGLGYSDKCFSFALVIVPMLSSVLPYPTAGFRRGLHPPNKYENNDMVEHYWVGHFNPATAICLAALEAIKGNE